MDDGMSAFPSTADMLGFRLMSAKCHKQTCCDMSATWLRLLFD